MHGRRVCGNRDAHRVTDDRRRDAGPLIARRDTGVLLPSTGRGRSTRSCRSFRQRASGRGRSCLESVFVSLVLSASVFRTVVMPDTPCGPCGPVGPWAPWRRSPPAGRPDLVRRLAPGRTCGALGPVCAVRAVGPSAPVAPWAPCAPVAPCVARRALVRLAPWAPCAPGLGDRSRPGFPVHPWRRSAPAGRPGPGSPARRLRRSRPEFPARPEHPSRRSAPAGRLGPCAPVGSSSACRTSRAGLTLNSPVRPGRRSRPVAPVAPVSPWMPSGSLCAGSALLGRLAPVPSAVGPAARRRRSRRPGFPECPVRPVRRSLL